MHKLHSIAHPWNKITEGEEKCLSLQSNRESSPEDEDGIVEANGNNCRIKIEHAAPTNNDSHGGDGECGGAADEDDSPRTVHVDSTLLRASQENLAAKLDKTGGKAASMESVELEVMKRKVHSAELTSIAVAGNGAIAATAV